MKRKVAEENGTVRGGTEAPALTRSGADRPEEEIQDLKEQIKGLTEEIGTLRKEGGALRWDCRTFQGD